MWQTGVPKTCVPGVRVKIRLRVQVITSVTSTFDLYEKLSRARPPHTFSSINHAPYLRWDSIPIEFVKRGGFFFGGTGGSSISIDQGATRRYRLASITVAEDVGSYREFRRHCRRIGVMDLADYPFSWVTAVMPESISAGEAEFGRRALYVRDINNWIKAGLEPRTSGSLVAPGEQPPPIQLLIPPGRDVVRARTCLRLFLPFLLPPAAHFGPRRVPLITFLLPNSMSQGEILPIESNSRAQQREPSAIFIPANAEGARRRAGFIGRRFGFSLS